MVIEIVKSLKPYFVPTESADLNRVISNQEIINSKLIFDFEKNQLIAEFQINIANIVLKNQKNETQINNSADIISSRKDELWKTTCFEFFLKDKLSTSYIEMNVNDIGQWNFYRFKNYRERDFDNPLTALVMPSQIKFNKKNTQPTKSAQLINPTELDKLEAAAFQLTTLSIHWPLSLVLNSIFNSDFSSSNLTSKINYKPDVLQRLQLNMTAVTEAKKINFWAIKHRTEKPDFHDFGSMQDLSSLLESTV